jgi:hypothetical protein
VAPDAKAWRRNHEVVFVDGSGWLNLAGGMTKAALQQVCPFHLHRPLSGIAPAPAQGSQCGRGLADCRFAERHGARGHWTPLARARRRKPRRPGQWRSSTMPLPSHLLPRSWRSARWGGALTTGSGSAARRQRPTLGHSAVTCPPGGACCAREREPGPCTCLGRPSVSGRCATFWQRAAWPSSTAHCPLSAIRLHGRRDVERKAQAVVAKALGTRATLVRALGRRPATPVLKKGAPGPGRPDILLGVQARRAARPAACTLDTSSAVLCPHAPP